MHRLHSTAFKYRSRNRTLAELLVLGSVLGTGVLIAYLIDRGPDSIVWRPWFGLAAGFAGMGLYIGWVARGTARLHRARQCAACDPAYPDAYYQLARHLFEKDRFAEAVSQFRNAIQLDTRLDIRKPYATIQRMLTRRAGTRLDEQNFIKWMVPRACMAYVLDESGRGAAPRRRGPVVDDALEGLGHVGAALHALSDLRADLARREARQEAVVLPWMKDTPANVRRARELQQLRRLVDELENIIRRFETNRS